jgi:hypothetical protein
LRVFFKLSRTLADCATVGAGTTRAIATLALPLPPCSRSHRWPARDSFTAITRVVPVAIEKLAVPIVRSV